jgi:hypothetical protein
MREQTGVKAGVSKVIPGVHERVLTVTGDVEAVSKVCFFHPIHFPSLILRRPTNLSLLNSVQQPYPLRPRFLQHPLLQFILQSDS